MNIGDLTRENNDLIKQALKILIEEKKRGDMEHLRELQQWQHERQ